MEGEAESWEGDEAALGCSPLELEEAGETFSPDTSLPVVPEADSTGADDIQSGDVFFNLPGPSISVVITGPLNPFACKDATRELTRGGGKPGEEGETPSDLLEGLSSDGEFRMLSGRLADDGGGDVDESEVVVSAFVLGAFRNLIPPSISGRI